MKASADAIASAMGLVGFALAVSEDDDLHRHIELVRLRDSQMLAIHATWSGAVFHKVVRLEHDVSQQTMDRAQNYLNEQFGGLSRKAMRQLTNEELKNAEFPSGTLHHRAFQLADLALPRQLEPDLDLIVGGQHHLLGLPEFSSGAMAGPILEALEPMDTWRTMLEAFRTNYDDPDVPSLENTPETAVLIGPEVPVRELSACTFVAGRLSWGDGVDGSVGLVGPMCLAYASAIAVVGFLRSAVRKRVASPISFAREP
jgi:heat-inducible transcriptional repressor